MKEQIYSKTALRKILLERRRQISAEKKQQAAESAMQLLINTDIFIKSQHIACYYPLTDEFDSLPIIQAIWQAKKHCYLPILAEKHLHFVEYSQDTELRPNRYGIPEPINQQAIPLEKLDFVLLPLVGFDLKGNRLGMGAGYYDRTFATKASVLLGLGYVIQETANIPHDPWDVLLDGVVTEKKLLLFGD